MKKVLAHIAIVSIITLTGLYIVNEWPNHNHDESTQDTNQPNTNDALGLALYVSASNQ